MTFRFYTYRFYYKKQLKRFLLTDTFIVDTSFIIMATQITSTTNDAKKILTNLSTKAIIITSAKRFAYTRGNVTVFITKTSRISRTNRTAKVFVTSHTRNAIPVTITRSSRCSDTSNLEGKGFKKY